MSDRSVRLVVPEQHIVHPKVTVIQDIELVFTTGDDLTAFHVYPICEIQDFFRNSAKDCKRIENANKKILFENLKLTWDRFPANFLFHGRAA